MANVGVVELREAILEEARRILESVLNKDTFTSMQLTQLSLGDVTVRDFAEQLIERAAELTRRTPDTY